jgi:hypothetical protein
MTDHDQIRDKNNQLEENDMRYKATKAKYGWVVVDTEDGNRSVHTGWMTEDRAFDLAALMNIERPR